MKKLIITLNGSQEIELTAEEENIINMQGECYIDDEDY